VGRDARSLVQLGWNGKPDVQWLADAGRLGWLVFSSNKKMLQVPSERATIIRERVGIVFLTNGEEYLATQLRLLLVKWEWLENLDRLMPRPFARFLAPNGRTSDRYRNLKL
jgi:hypothetical protein